MQKQSDQIYYTRRADSTRAQAERCEDARARVIYQELADLYEQAANDAHLAPRLSSPA